MTLFDFAILAILAAACGFAGQFLTGYSRGGCPVSVVAGFVGAWLGPWVARYFGQPELFILPIEPADPQAEVLEALRARHRVSIPVPLRPLERRRGKDLCRMIGTGLAPSTRRRNRRTYLVPPDRST
jgi:uncharacterized membrane protein YeaQ/YmgE (transglycosylase-associated protein family)